MSVQWLFLTLNAEWSGDFDKVLAAAEEYFRRKGIRHHRSLPLTDALVLSELCIYMYVY